LILDENGVILETNKAWRNYAVKGGLPEDQDNRRINLPLRSPLLCISYNCYDI
jgi:hypothetical protein